ncbi:phosphomethylpyrimidine kinase [Sulfolobus islandicus Y.G.57.14]|uniref:Hydroxymethylpyrimidine/phosphomethylpyrimidinek inase n=5 Tax=Saccharolobus islandicus TaxID=43080 RepID=M9UGT4_SACIS|nr:bifunctional hydroxymethylpyrimidine kinase/phosphomethylpyrimidine kinase [Sulfolobus islandicus]ACP36262.1 phosphomethylpyrimidine kinase [Sulfolobus islandicus L.S.2.15]ACP46490.1 phosphomethylpyrimidine kinase [Sulfolobus islandicus Y.G.57.14]ACP47804.1 phosphomethylpyrimidine kinase [Sulfolobus islandicus Y.N.15.51]ADX86051.1 phosphomethylpyrimidine kinase [Sulfolobus islandicus REY15A]AGJ63410.1 Hydroxymethylpyrimidine/phosphomethylpyrimidinekinase [Sulfolobus islandicus LAL14/1]
MHTRPVVATIAGSDSGGGAGLQADLKTFTALGVFGTTIITGLTAQNTKAVTKVLEIPPDFIEAQFDAVCQDLRPSHAKTGMLASGKIIELVLRKIKEYQIKLVLDPVMVAKSGSLLITEDISEQIRKAMREAIISTPNRYEAEIIANTKINSQDDVIKTAREIYSKYGNVVVKGFNGVDYAIIDGEEIELKGDYIGTKNTHGSGDVFSASITAYLALGYKLRDAVIRAKRFTSLTIKYGLDLGGGYGPVDPFAPVESIVKREEGRNELENLLWFLESNLNITLKLINDTSKVNVAYMTNYNDVLSLAGGLIKYLEKIKIDGPILNNVSNEITKIMRETSSEKIGILLPLTDKILDAAEKGKIKLSKSGINGDAILRDNMVLVVGKDKDDLIRKLKEVVLG